MIPCPICGATSRRAHDEATGLCARPKPCNERRCKRRKAQDRERGVREQCHGTYGKTSVRFCILTVGHEGLHLQGTHEWEGDFESPLAKFLRDHESTWERVRALLRAEGKDPDELIRRAGENLRRFQAMTPEQIAAIPWPDMDLEV